jgi:NAD(P)-dependent dehydrogenase (short-subunit alcohol dehydrogenase family)
MNDISSYFRLDQRVALITGGTSGLGLAIAEVFLRAGATVFITARRADRGQAALERLRPWGPVQFFPADVSQRWDVERLFDWLRGQTHRLDILVNNAGIMQVKDLTEMTEEEWEREWNIHVKGTFLCTQQALRFMLGQASGVILNISSYLGLRGGSGFTPAYSAAKGAIVTFTKVLASRYGPYGIRANVLCPGFIPTDLNRHILEEAPDPVAKRREIEERYPLRRLGEPIDVALAALYLCSDAARWVSGAVLVIDGGLSVR